MKYKNKQKKAGIAIFAILIIIVSLVVLLLTMHKTEQDYYFETEENKNYKDTIYVQINQSYGKAGGVTLPFIMWTEDVFEYGGHKVAEGIDSSLSKIIRIDIDGNAISEEYRNCQFDIVEISGTITCRDDRRKIIKSLYGRKFSPLLFVEGYKGDEKYDHVNTSVFENAIELPFKVTLFNVLFELDGIKPVMHALLDEEWNTQEAAKNALASINPKWMKSDMAVEFEGEIISALKSKNESVRNSAVETLRIIKTLHDIKPIADMIKTSEWELRKTATDVLSIIDNPEAVDLLIDLLKDERGEIRKYSATALGEKKARKAIEPLIDLLIDKDQNVRTAVWNSLDKINPEWKKEKLTEKMISKMIASLEDNVWSTRCASAWSLGLLKDQRAVKYLISALQNDKQWEVREESAKALGEIADSESVDALISALKDESREVSQSAARALAKIKSQKVIELLKKKLEEKDLKFKESVIIALGEIGDSTAIEKIIVALSDGNSMVRISAVEALGKIGNRRAIDPLISALQDKDPEIRDQVVKALGCFDDPKVTKSLINALKSDPSTFVRGSAAEILGRKKVREAEESLILALDDNNAYVRFSALKALSMLKNPKSVKYIIPKLTDIDSEVREAAVEVLGELRAQEAVGALIILLHDEQLAVQNASVKALEKITGVKFGTDAGKWQIWWEKNKKRFR